MILIGILTRNRPVYLDATLRSLSATELPADAPVIVYDDASTDAKARRYLDTTDVFHVEHRWPRCAAWTAAGLDFLPDNPTLRGIADHVQVVAVGHAAAGVTNASCFAVRDLFARYPDASNVILLQDDVVFNADWHERLTGQIGQIFARGGRQGIVAGMHLDARDIRFRGAKSYRQTAPVRFVSAQCYLIRRAFFEDQRQWFERADHERKNFDKYLCGLARGSGWEIHLVVPYVCQHIGVTSKVRPKVEFYRDERAAGRIGLGASGPYAFADEVRCFIDRLAEVVAC